MRIALPTRGTEIDDHFGHCEAFTIFTIDGNNKIESSEILPSPSGCGCKSGVAGILQEKGVSILLAGNMGQGAINVLAMHGIEVCRGCNGNVRETVEAFLEGHILDNGGVCQHQHGEGHDHGHQCGH